MSPVYTCGLDEPGCRDRREFGGKATGLARLAAAGLPVPPGFAVGAAAYRAFLDRSGLRAELVAALAGGTGGVPAAARLGRRLAAAPVPEPVATAIRRHYQRLCDQTGIDRLAVAVRSSATAEDAAAASFAGGYDSWLGVAGADEVVAHVHRCWGGTVAARAVGYARANRVDPAGVAMAVVVQQLVRARAAGVMFTISPVTGDRSRIVIEASWGLGQAVAGGEVIPDRWVVDKVALAVVGRTPGDKRIEYAGGAAAVAVEPARWRQPCLTDDQVLALARLGRRLERQQQCPQDIEFAVDGDRPAGQELVLLQHRPETVWSTRPHRPRYAAGDGVTAWISAAVTGRAGRPA